MTKRELLESIEDMPMDAVIYIRHYDREYGGEVSSDNLRVENYYGKYDRGTIIITEKL